MSFKSNALLEFMWTPSKPYHRYILWLSMDKSQEWTNSKHAVLRRGRSGHNKSVFKEVDRFMFFFFFFFIVVAMYKSQLFAFLSLIKGLTGLII